jgi:allophanate hydrolase
MITSINAVSISALLEQYKRGAYSPTQMVKDLFVSIRKCKDSAIWTTLLDEQVCLDAAKKLEASNGSIDLPLYGIPFSVKDNIDVEGINTSCSVEGYIRMPKANAKVVQRALDAGAILIGKNSLDQFATGLSGTRVVIPHCLNPFNSDVIPGGSSSGSGVAVSRGLVSFAIGTDTGGSGRIPAAMNNIVGIKPTLGILSDYGLVHNSRFLDTASVFAQTVFDCGLVLKALIDDCGRYKPNFDNADLKTTEYDESHSFRFAIPGPNQLEFYGDNNSKNSFEDAVTVLESMGGERVIIDFEWFKEAGKMPFDSGLLAERYFNYGDILDKCRENVHPALIETLEKSKRYSKDDFISAVYDLKEKRRNVKAILKDIDCLIVPTVAKSFLIKEIQEDPVVSNHKVGQFTYFLSPLDLCGIAVPAAIKEDGVPFGITICGLPGMDGKIYDLAHKFQKCVSLDFGVDETSIGK